MPKKKPFIDRKTASVYHVVRRSQRDVGTEATAETLSDFVLMADPENERREELKRRLDEQVDGGDGGQSGMQAGRKAVDFNQLKSHYAKAGLLDSQATTYNQYTKPISRTGAFFASDSNANNSNLNELLTDTSKNDLDTALQEAMQIHEVGRMLDSIALTADCMEDDVAQALFDFEEGEFEEILDDFCLTANLEELPAESGENGGGCANGEFNFEEHIRQLMEKARMQENGGGEGRELEDDFFGGVKPLHERIDEEEDDDFDYERYDEEEDSLDREFGGGEYVKPTTDEQQRVLCQKFQEALLEYDSDDLGDLDEECEEIGGHRPLEGDAQLEAALDEFLTEKEDEVLIEGTKHTEEKRRGGSGYSALVGKTMVPSSQLGEDTLLINMEESKRQMAEDLADADAILANPEMDLPPEEILIDGKSYFSVTSRNVFDCESILSTYSNLDNHPVVVGRSSRRSKKKVKKKQVDEESIIPEDKPVKIQLSNKTGLPLGVFDKHQLSPEQDYHNETDTYISINKGEARNKSESVMEKKVRKTAVKEERKICRIQKKMMREAFREEFTKRGEAGVVDAVGGTTVFRFS